MHYQTFVNAFLSWTSLDPQTTTPRHNDLNKLGNLSPYHPAHQPCSVKADLPSDCKVDQVILLHRHGSRGPGSAEDELIRALVDTLGEAQEVIRDADLPPELRFLKEGYEYDLVPEALTIIGRQQLFNHGVEFALKYPNLSTNTILSSWWERVIESAHFFALGDFGPDSQDVQFKTVDDLAVDVNWILPWDACPNYGSGAAVALQAAYMWAARYIPPITARLNELLPGVNLIDEDTHGALFACPYDLAARNKSPWCDVFLPGELRDLEYEMDLIMNGLSGFGLPNDMGLLLGSVYVNKLIERLTNSNGDAKELYLEFGHDASILLVLAAMGLNEDIPPLSPDHIRPHRKFRTSKQTPFAAQMIWEKFTCENSFEGPQVRLLLNDATYPLSICEKTHEDRKYGTCSLEEFVRANRKSANIYYGDATWNATCGQ
ncbi:phosphoglycerate mutase-like protein [Gyrodon lividus]|nr:phosphoglycerate mutase-like protein [Gyrodon lividus]